MGDDGEAVTEPEPCPEFGFYAYADQFYDAFNKLEGHLHPSVSWPRYFLLCHSIELALKAYLAKIGMTEKQLTHAKRRHNLRRLMNEAVEKGLRLTPTTQHRIKLLAKAHSKFWHRYPWKWEISEEVYVIEQFIPYAHELINEVCKEVHGVSWGEAVKGPDR
jgi:hypothetical protein